MSWDDEDFEVPTSSKDQVAASWEDDAEDDEPVLESWDVDSDEEREKEKAKQAEQARKKAAAAAITAAKKKTTAAKGKKATPALLDIDKVDEATRREMLRKAELDSDLNNAADLFGGLGVADEHPRARAAAAQAAIASQAPAPVLTKDTPISSHPLFEVETKADFEKLRKEIAPALTKLANISQLNYSSALAIDLIRDLCGPLTVEQLRKATSTLNVAMKEKEKQERQARLAKAGTSVGGAGKKKAKPAAKSSLGSSSFKKDLDFDTTNYDNDNFGDDDFM